MDDGGPSLQDQARDQYYAELGYWHAVMDEEEEQGRRWRAANSNTLILLFED